MKYATARATCAAELRTAASIRREIAERSRYSTLRRGMLDAHRDCIRTARFARIAATLSAASQAKRLPGVTPQAE